MEAYSEPVVLNDFDSDSDEENFLSQLKRKIKKNNMNEGYGYEQEKPRFQPFGTGFGSQMDRGQGMNRGFGNSNYSQQFENY